MGAGAMSGDLRAPALREPDSPGGVAVECPSCQVEFDPAASTGQAERWAGLHNGPHHGGRTEATTVATGRDTAEPAPGGFASGLGWLLSPSVFDDALRQARPYTGDVQAVDRAWSARVDAAVQGMDVLDPAGLDEWIAAHAESAAPHLAEAALVAVWETHVRGLFPHSSDLRPDLIALDGGHGEPGWAAGWAELPDAADEDVDGL
jgi:hypothetical protein